MAPYVQEIDESMFKVRRAASRARSLHKKRTEFQRTCKRLSSAAPEGRDDKLRTRPHRVARAAARTCLAKGLVEVAADMPTIVYMDCAGWRKPSVAARIAVPWECSDLDAWCCSQGYLEEYTSAAGCLDFLNDCFPIGVFPYAESTAAELMQRQKAQQDRKQAEQDRQREQLVARELQECRAKAEEEVASVMARAVASAEVLKAKAREEVQAAKAWAEEKARHTAEEAEATRLAAEELAWDVKAKAEQEAQALMAQKVLQQAEREAAVEAPEVPKVEAGSQDTSYCGKGEPMQPVEAEWEVLLDDTEDPDAGFFDWKVIA